MNIQGKWVNDVKSVFTPELWGHLGVTVIRIVIIIVIGRLLVWTIDKTITRFLEKESKLQLQSRRAKTVGKLMKNAASGVTYFIVLLLVLAEFNVNLGLFLQGQECLV